MNSAENSGDRSDNHSGHEHKPEVPPGRPDDVPPPRPSKPITHRPVGVV